MKPLIFLAMPTRGRPHIAAQSNAHALIAGTNWQMSAVQRNMVTTARNECVRLFLKTRASHLLFIDDDTIAPGHTIDDLLLADVDIASAITPFVFKGEIVSNVCYAGEDYTLTLTQCLQHVEPFAIQWCGMGCCLIRRIVFEKMEFPWFSWGENDDGQTVGEDVMFCMKAGDDLGFSLCCCPTVWCGHIKEVNVLRMANLLHRDIPCSTN